MFTSSVSTTHKCAEVFEALIVKVEEINCGNDQNSEDDLSGNSIKINVIKIKNYLNI